MPQGIGKHDQSGEFSFSGGPDSGQQQARLACISGVHHGYSSRHKPPLPEWSAQSSHFFLLPINVFFSSAL
jgi:hypothetical protein